MPCLDGLEATRRISADDDLAGVKVIILTTYETDDDALISPSVTRRLIADIAARPHRPTAPASALAGLTDRERETMSLVGTGLPNDEIATRLFLSPLTVKTRVSRAMTKLGARARAQLVVLAYETGLITPGR